jgi:tetratricopeptide (TPR) repeat protein
MELAPGNTEVLRSVGLLAHDLGRSEEAMDLCRRAVEQDPLSVASYTYYGRACRGAELLTEAEEAFRKALEMSPDAASTHLLLAFVLDAEGRPEEALSEAMRESASWARLYGLAVLHHKGGRPSESDRALRELTEKHGHEAAYQVACAHAVRGEADAAFEWMERAYTQHDSGLALMLLDAQLRSLHTDPRWKTFLRKMGLAD